MKNQFSIFEKYLMGDLKSKDLEGVRFLDTEIEKDLYLNLEIDEHLRRFFKETEHEKALIKSLNEIRKGEKGRNNNFKPQLYNSLSWINSRVVAACFVLVIGMLGVLLSARLNPNPSTKWENLRPKNVIINFSSQLNFPFNESGGNQVKAFSSLSINLNSSINEQKQNLEVQLGEENKSKILKSLGSLPSSNDSGLMEYLGKKIASGFVVSKENELRYTNHSKVNFKKSKHFLHLAKKSQNKGLNIEAEKYYSKSLMLNPNNQDAYYGRALVNFNLGKDSKAVKDLNKILKLNPENYNVYLGRGVYYLKKGKIKKSRRDFMKLQEINENGSLGIYFMAHLYRKRGRTYKAKKDYLQALILDPKNLIVQNGSNIFFKAEKNDLSKVAMGISKKIKPIFSKKCKFVNENKTYCRKIVSKDPSDFNDDFVIGSMEENIMLP